MVEKRLEKSETKTCEACGAEFSCGANAGKCWCFEIDSSAETLAKLRENFTSCLCENCLTGVQSNVKNND
jgi:hypothetical protein